MLGVPILMTSYAVVCEKSAVLEVLTVVCRPEEDPLLDPKAT